MKIKIQEPCRENWEAMTAEKTGAFCHSCAKSVVDFSKMGIQQIKDFLQGAGTEKICGRFEKQQLKELNFDEFYASFRLWNLSRKFAVIFFFTFGLWLFPQANALAQKVKNPVTQVCYPSDAKKMIPTQTTQTQKDTVIKIVKQEPNPQYYEMGMVVRMPDTKKEPKKETKKCKKKGDGKIMGDINIE